MSKDKGETWQVRWDNHSRWQVIALEGKPSEEGTQAFRLIAECTSHFDAEGICLRHNATQPTALQAALPELLDELEPAWHEAYSDPLNVVRVLHQRALEVTAVQQAALERVPAWALKGRDGEPVTLLQKLEQEMEFGSAMERLAIENNRQLKAAEDARDEAVEALTDIRDNRLPNQVGQYVQRSQATENRLLRERALQALAAINTTQAGETSELPKPEE